MITTTIKECKKVGTKFPKLMKSNDSSLIVLFESKNSGTVIVEGDTWKVGESTAHWDDNGFEDFTGELILKNN